jgi:hypothetical protein
MPIEGLKGIDKLEAFLQSKFVNIPPMIEYLRNLQELRSTGVAHLKGRKYSRIKETFEIDKKDLQEVFDLIMVGAIKTLNSLEKVFLQN